MAYKWGLRTFHISITITIIICTSNKCYLIENRKDKGLYRLQWERIGKYLNFSSQFKRLSLAFGPIEGGHLVFVITIWVIYSTLLEINSGKVSHFHTCFDKCVYSEFVKCKVISMGSQQRLGIHFEGLENSVCLILWLFFQLDNH